MQTELFYSDNAAVFNTAALREQAAREVSSSSLICRAAAGDLAAAKALHVGFWPFVKEFEEAIDQHSIPRGRLRKRFGREKFANTFRGMAEAVREMKREEGSHASAWKADAQGLGLPELRYTSAIPGVQRLIDAAFTDDSAVFFSVLAGTEFIAEELSRFLVGSRRFTAMFKRKRWVWGDIHCMPHDHGPSHLEIDLDFARALSDSEPVELAIRQNVLTAITLFGLAAKEVEATLCPIDTATAAAE